ncbi:MAG: Sua5/YciO/YrdC/YwlC family protein [Candidatus Promineofilum sp.]|nr:Sua5/YciO/YrdC/YwlC family protein [Promineifilum sp.]
MTAHSEQMSTLRLDAADPAAIATAADLLRRGLPVVFPTDTVYGVGVLPSDATAIELLYTAKGRPAEKGIPVLLGDVADVAHVAGIIPPAAAALMAHFWPGPLTLVVPRRPGCRPTCRPTTPWLCACPTTPWPAPSSAPRAGRWRPPAPTFPASRRPSRPMRPWPRSAGGWRRCSTTGYRRAAWPRRSSIAPASGRLCCAPGRCRPPTWG